MRKEEQQTAECKPMLSQSGAAGCWLKQQMPHLAHSAALAGVAGAAVDAVELQQMKRGQGGAPSTEVSNGRLHAASTQTPINSITCTTGRHATYVKLPGGVEQRGEGRTTVRGLPKSHNTSTHIEYTVRMAKQEGAQCKRSQHMKERRGEMLLRFRLIISVFV